MDMLSLTTGERLLVFRHRAKLSKAELGRRIGVSAATISRYENDESEPGEDTLDSLSIVLDISINKLLYGFDDPSKEQGLKRLV